MKFHLVSLIFLGLLFLAQGERYENRNRDKPSKSGKFYKYYKSPNSHEYRKPTNFDEYYKSESFDKYRNTKNREAEKYDRYRKSENYQFRSIDQQYSRDGGNFRGKEKKGKDYWMRGFHPHTLPDSYFDADYYGYRDSTHNPHYDLMSKREMAEYYEIATRFGEELFDKRGRLRVGKIPRRHKVEMAEIKEDESKEVTTQNTENKIEGETKVDIQQAPPFDMDDYDLINAPNKEEVEIKSTKDEKTKEEKTKEEKTEEEKTEEEKTEDVKTEDVKTEDVKTEDVKTEDEKTEDVKTEDEKTEDEKTKDEKTKDEKTEDEKTKDEKNEAEENTAYDHEVGLLSEKKDTSDLNFGDTDYDYFSDHEKRPH